MAATKPSTAALHYVSCSSSGTVHEESSSLHAKLRFTAHVQYISGEKKKLNGHFHNCNEDYSSWK
jgi:hypothetical protein